MRWKVYFHGERADLLARHDDPVVLQHRDVLLRAAAAPRREGQPFLLDPLGAPDLRVDRWFDSDEVRDLGRLTWRKYAYSLAGVSPKTDREGTPRSRFIPARA